MTYRGWLARAVKRFEECGIEEAEADAWLLLAHGAGIDRLYYSLNGGEEISEEKLRVLEELAVKRCAHIPVQRLTGEAWFMGYSFYVNDHVLVPRKDLEVLAEYVLSVLAEKQGKRDPGESGRPPAASGSLYRIGMYFVEHFKGNNGNFGNRDGYFPEGAGGGEGKCHSAGRGGIVSAE